MAFRARKTGEDMTTYLRTKQAFELETTGKTGIKLGPAPIPTAPTTITDPTIPIRQQAVQYLKDLGYGSPDEKEIQGAIETLQQYDLTHLKNAEVGPSPTLGMKVEPTGTDKSAMDKIIKTVESYKSGYPEAKEGFRENLIEMLVRVHGEDYRQFAVDTIYRELRSPTETTYKPPTYEVYQGVNAGVDPNEQARIDAANQVNEAAQIIFDNIPKGDDVDIRESTKILDDIQTKLEETEEKIPAPKSLVDLFKAEKEKLGIEPLETELADIDANIERIQTELLVKAEEAGEKLISTREIGRAKGVLQKRADREIALLNVERSAVARILGNKIDTLNTLVNLTDMDYDNASDYYTKEYNRTIQLYNLVSGAEEKELTHAERARDDARANWSVITTALQEQGISYGDLTESQKLKIEQLETQAGLPEGFAEKTMGLVETDEKIVGSPIVSADKTKVSILIRESDGTLRVETIDTGLPAKVEEIPGFKFTPNDRGELNLIGISNEDITGIQEGIRDYGWPVVKQTEIDAGRPEEQIEAIESILGGVTPSQKEKEEEDVEKAKLDLGATIDDYKEAWKKEGDKNKRGTREEFIAFLVRDFPELTQEEISDEVYSQVSDEWMEENTSAWRKIFGVPK